MLDIERYLIPTTAMEAVFSSTVDYDNKKLISQKYPMIIFCPQDKSYYRAPFSKLLKEYDYQGGVVFELGKFLSGLLKGEDVSPDLNIGTSEELLSKLIAKLKTLPIRSNININEGFLMILESCREFMYYNNIMIGIYSDVTSDYELIIFRHYPVMIFNPSLWKTIAGRSKSATKMTIKEVINRNKEFDRTFKSNSRLGSQSNE